MNYRRNGYRPISASYSIPNCINGTYDYSFFIPREGSKIPAVPDEDDEYDDDDWDDYDFDYCDYDYNGFR